ncbi:hypothetical protein ACFYSF_45725 [Streptomyces canus]|uniref:hypothetical protein n=1 Tax=Streptomyces canus TaxID=58343 RepID=UPI003685C076
MSVGYPAWWFVPVGVVPTLLFAARASAADDTAQHVIWWLACALILIIAGFAILSRIVVMGTKLGMPATFAAGRPSRWTG